MYNYKWLNYKSKKCQNIFFIYAHKFYNYRFFSLNILCQIIGTSYTLVHVIWQETCYISGICLYCEYKKKNVNIKTIRLKANILWHENELTWCKRVQKLQ